MNTPSVPRQVLIGVSMFLLAACGSDSTHRGPLQPARSPS